MKTLMRAVGSLIISTLILLFLLIGIFTLAIQAGTVTLFITQSGSMLPRYPIQAVLIAVPTDWETIRVGDVITVRKEGNGSAITHRVTSVSDTIKAGERVFITDEAGKTFEMLKVTEDTSVRELRGGAGRQVGRSDVAVQMKGDANNSADAETYLIKSQVWKPVLQIKGVGHILEMGSQPLTLIIGGSIIGGLLIIVLLLPTRKDDEAFPPKTVNPPLSPPSYGEVVQFSDSQKVTQNG